MFRKGDLIKVIGDEDEEVFIVIKTSASMIESYNIYGNAKYKRDNTKLMVKPIDNPRFPGQIIISKSMCENLMAKKKVKPYSFLD